MIWLVAAYGIVGFVVWCCLCVGAMVDETVLGE